MPFALRRFSEFCRFHSRCFAAHSAQRVCSCTAGWLQRHSILTFAAEYCDWDNEYPTPNIHGIDCQAWTTLQGQHQELFNK